MKIRSCLTAALAAALLAAACGRPPALWRTVFRVIDDPPSAFFEKTELLAVEVFEIWRFRTPEDLAPWTPARIDLRYERRGADLLIQSSKKRPRLLRSVAWRGEEVDALELDVLGFSRGLGILEWAGPGEEFSEQRRVVARRTGDFDPERMVFDVAFHPLWRGEIERVKLQFEPADDQRIRLREIRVARYRPVAEKVAAAGGRPWQIDLDHEARGGLLALPGVAIERRLEVPEQGVLRLGFGTDPSARLAMAFSCELELAGGERVALLEAEVVPAAGESSDPPDGALASGRWHDREIDLAAYRGSSGTLRLEARSAAAPFELLRGLAYWSGPEITSPAAEAPPNVVLISIDTLRPDHLSLHGYERDTSPELARWAAERAVVFEQVVAPSPWTLPSHLSMLTGLDALSHGLNHSGSVASGFELLAERLRGAGYSTLAVTGGGFLHPDHGFSQGFDRYRYWPEARSESELEAGVERAFDWVETHADRPFFLFFHTYEVHYPYRRREPFFSRFAGEEQAAAPEIYLGIKDARGAPEEGFLLSQNLFWKPEKRILERSPVGAEQLPEVVARYDSGIAFADSRLAPLLARLARPGLAERTLVIVTSDHGEALGERGLGGHAYLYDFNLRVPMVVAWPDGRGRGTRVEDQVRLVDVAPTVLELAGVEVPRGLDGESLAPLVAGDAGPASREAWGYAAFSNRGVALRVDSRLKYLFNNTAWAPLTGHEELYDLARDPLEEHDLSGGRSTSALRRRVAERLGEVGEGRFRVSFENASLRPFGGRIRGGAIHPAIVKAIEVPDGALVWREIGEADFRVLPGESFTLHLERVEGRWLKLEGAMDAAPPAAEEAFAEALEVEGFEGEWGMVWTGNGWQSGALSEPPEGLVTGVFVSYHPGATAAADGAPQVDPRLVEQLQALGYVD